MTPRTDVVSGLIFPCIESLIGVPSGTPAPPSEADWERSVEAFNADRRAILELVTDPKRDLIKPFPHGSGQNLLREALLVADHTAYHLGQLIAVRRLLGCWPSNG